MERKIKRTVDENGNVRIVEIVGDISDEEVKRYELEIIEIMAAVEDLVEKECEKRDIQPHSAMTILTNVIAKICDSYVTEKGAKAVGKKQILLLIETYITSLGDLHEHYAKKYKRISELDCDD